MTIGTWNSIIYRLIKSRKRHVKSDKERYSSPKMNVLSFTPDSNNKINGILRHFCNEAGGNVHDKGVVDIWSSVQNQFSYYPKTVADYDSSNYFAPENVENVDISNQRITRYNQQLILKVINISVIGLLKFLMIK